MSLYFGISNVQACLSILEYQIYKQVSLQMYKHVSLFWNIKFTNKSLFKCTSMSLYESILEYQMYMSLYLGILNVQACLSILEYQMYKHVSLS